MCVLHALRDYAAARRREPESWPFDPTLGRDAIPVVGVALRAEIARLRGSSLCRLGVSLSNVPVNCWRGLAATQSRASPCQSVAPECWPGRAGAWTALPWAQAACASLWTVFHPRLVRLMSISSGSDRDASMLANLGAARPVRLAATIRRSRSASVEIATAPFSHLLTWLGVTPRVSARS